MQITTFWLAIAGFLTALELATGTFYLLVFAIAACAAFLFAAFGFSLVVQLAATAVVGVSGVILLRGRHKARSPCDDGLDIGQLVEVTNWRDNDTARVQYRGTEWDAVLRNEDVLLKPQYCRIHGIQGTTLILTAANP